MNLIEVIKPLTGTDELWINGSIAIIWAILIGYLLISPFVRLIDIRRYRKRWQ